MNLQQHDITLAKIPKKVLKRLFSNKKPMKTGELVNELNLNLRSVRYALKVLEEMELIKRQPDFNDLRTHYYYIPSTIFNQLSAPL